MSPRPPKFHFYLDENFPVPAGKFLKSLGHNVLFVVEKKKLRGLTDLSQIKESNRQKRIFIALDKDFFVNESLKGAIKKGQGIILVGSADPSSEKVIMILKKLLKKISSQKLEGKICRASIDKIVFS